MSRDASRGFTLVELMVTVSILGVLASVAIPTLMRLTLRSKQAERRHVMNTIKAGVDNLYVQLGDLPPDPGTGQPLPAMTGNWNPAWPPGDARKAPVWTQDDWNKILDNPTGTPTAGAPAVEGALYFSYMFTIARGGPGNPTMFTMWSAGDLDGDVDFSLRQVTYQRDPGGVFRPVDGAGFQYPVGWLDQGTDDGKF
jgi:prepilin-type N-terminal cleavage/methylation domain-containing protein